MLNDRCINAQFLWLYPFYLVETLWYFQHFMIIDVFYTLFNVFVMFQFLWHNLFFSCNYFYVWDLCKIAIRIFNFLFANSFWCGFMLNDRCINAQFLWLYPFYLVETLWYFQHFMIIDVFYTLFNVFVMFQFLWHNLFFSCNYFYVWDLCKIAIRIFNFLFATAASFLTWAIFLLSYILIFAIHLFWWFLPEANA